MNLRLTNIQRFSTYDGPGIRTTLFVKGCGIRCPWCSNPENLSYEIQEYLSDRGTEKQYGKDYSVSELYEICMRDKEYYGSEGGVTASGGEALLQADALTELFSLLHSQNVTCGIETSLFVPQENLTGILDYLDFIYFDIKILNRQKAKEILKGDLNLYFQNIDFLFKNYDKNKIIVRIPIVKELTDNEENLLKIKELLGKYKPGKCEIFSVHNLGAAKYRTLGLEYNNFEVCSVELLDKYSSLLSQTGVQVTINRL